MRRLVPALLLVLLTGVAGCGDPQERYCASVEEHRKELADMTSSEAGGAALLRHLPMLQDLAADAPPDLQDEWQTFLTAVEGLDKALRAADVRPEQFGAGKPPSGLSKPELQRIQAAATRLASPDVVQAASGIEQEARDVCKVNIGL